MNDNRSVEVASLWIQAMGDDPVRLDFVEALLLDLLLDHEQSPVGDCFAAAHRALLDRAMENGLRPDTRRPPPPPPEPPPWNANPNVVALNAKLVEVQQQLDVANQRWRDLERQRAEDQARRDFEERFPGSGAG